MAVKGEDEFRVRPGRIRSRAETRARPFVAQALAAAERAGGRVSRDGRIVAARRSTFGRGRSASIRANRFITSHSRGVVVKARVVRLFRAAAPLVAHLTYLRREGVTRDGGKGRMFGVDTDRADHDAFAGRCKDDRHHFRFIVSPDDASELGDLRGFARQLMRDMERDLETRLDWVGIDHWNTEHPHLHIIVRGIAEDGTNLVISREYIRQGMRDRASGILTQTLGPRTDVDIRRTVERQIEAGRWTQLDRQLLRDVNRRGIIDLAPRTDLPPDEFVTLKVGRLRKLEKLGLATEISPGQWIMSEEAESTLRALGERGDIIKRLHRSLARHGLERGMSGYVLASEQIEAPVVGRLLERRLDDELRGTAFAIVDGTDGRAHHIRFHDLDATGDSAPGSIVELRRYQDRRGHHRVALAVRSDLPIEGQIAADGATWLDRQLVTAASVEIGEGGFGAEVRRALEARADHLVEEGLARRQGQRLVFARNLLGTLHDREVGAFSERLAAETGLPFAKAAEGDAIAGIYRQRFALATGRYAMIDDGLGFTLVPWSPSLERHLGNQVSGIVRPGGSIDWSFARKRGLVL